MKFINNRLALLTVSFATLTLLSGCGDLSQDSVEEVVSEKNSDGVYDPVITITVGKQLEENAGSYFEGESLNDNVLTRWGEEELGIKIETTLLGGDAENYDTKLRLALTGSETLPDVFPVYSTSIMSDMIESGQVKDLSEDIQQYMPERLQDIYAEFPEAFYPVTGENGEIYGLPVNPNLTEGQVMFIRQDWLNNLGLEAPTTIDEFEAVLDAFTNDDPDGNGVDDTYGFAFSGSGFNTGWVSDSVMIFSAYTNEFLPGQWQENDNGELEYGSIQDGNKEALVKLRDWYDQGYLNEEFAVLGAWEAFAPFVEGEAGIVLGRPWLEGSLADVTTADEDAEIAVYPFIQAVNGGVTYQSAETNDGIFMFNNDFQHMEAFFEYYDRLYDVAFGTGDFQYGGFFEGYDYDIVNGEPVFVAEEFDPPMDSIQEVGKMSLAKNTPSIEMGGRSFYDVFHGKEPETGSELKAASATPIQLEGYAISYEYRDTLISSQFNTVPTSTMGNSWEQLQTMEIETFTEIIYGRRDIEEFDVFVEEWNNRGGEQITQEVNEWYQSIQ